MIRIARPLLKSRCRGSLFLCSDRRHWQLDDAMDLYVYTCALKFNVLYVALVSCFNHFCSQDVVSWPAFVHMPHAL